MSRFWEAIFKKTLKLCFYSVFLCLAAKVLAPGLTSNALSIAGRFLHVDISPYLTFYRSLVPNLVSASIVFIVGLSWTGLRKWLLHSRARFFWGKGLFDGSFVVSHGTLSDERLLQPEDHFRFFKTYRDGRTIRVAGPAGNVLGDCEVRSISYLLTTLSRYRQKPVSIESDVTAYTKLSRTLVSLGSPASNELTEIILSEGRNHFAAFDQDETGPFIYLKSQRLKVRAFRGSPRRDLGLVLKIRNERFPGHYFYVCAGFGEWGTSGAAWYLANRWRELDDVGEEFGEIVEVEIGSDESARCVAVTKESRQMKHPVRDPEIPFGTPDVGRLPSASAPFVSGDSSAAEKEPS